MTDAHTVFLNASRGDVAGILASLPSLEVRDSPGKGKGVFTPRDIKEGQYVTFYPNHALLRSVESMTAGEVCEFDVIGKRRGTTVTHHMFAVYGVAAGYHNLVVVGDPDICEPRALGHMINDKARSNSEEDEAVYKVVSARGANVTAVTFFVETMPFIFMKATQDIAAGKELLFSYGLDYWRPKRNRTDSEPARLRRNPFRRLPIGLVAHIRGFAHVQCDACGEAYDDPREVKHIEYTGVCKRCAYL